MPNGGSKILVHLKSLLYLDEGVLWQTYVSTYIVLYIILKAATLQIPAGTWNMSFCWYWQPHQQPFAVNQPLYHQANEKHPRHSIYALSSATDHNVRYPFYISDLDLAPHTHVKTTRCQYLQPQFERRGRGAVHQHKAGLLCMTVTAKIIKQIRKFFKCSRMLECVRDNPLCFDSFIFVFCFFASHKHFTYLCNLELGTDTGQQLQDAQVQEKNI